MDPKNESIPRSHPFYGQSPLDTLDVPNPLSLSFARNFPCQSTIANRSLGIVSIVINFEIPSLFGLLEPYPLVGGSICTLKKI